MTDDTWFKIRMGLTGLTFVSGLALPSQEADIPQWPVVFSVVACLLISLFAVFGVLFVIGFQAFSPLSDKVWKRPTHRTNPFRLGNPLPFFHFGAFYSGAGGLGMLISTLWKGTDAAMIGAFITLNSACVLVGVHLAMRVFEHKLRKEPVSGEKTQPHDPPTR